MIIFIACSTRATPASSSKTTSSPEVSLQKFQRAAWEEDWEKTIKAAQIEGKVVVYSGSDPAVRQAQAKAFKERFGITMEIIPGRTGEIETKLITEHRNNIFYADLDLGGQQLLTMLKSAGVLDRLEQALVLPEVLDSKLWYGGKLPFVDKEHFIAVMSLAPATGFIINTSLVKPGEINSYQDLLSLKWKGKIILADPTRPPGGNQWFAAYVSSDTLSLDYMRALAKQEPFLRAMDRRQIAEWLSRGKYSISIGTGWNNFDEYAKAGAPIKLINPTEGDYLTAAAGLVALIKDAPHPNAAKVFINWFLSKEGATVFSKAYDRHSTRLDVPTEGINESRLRQPGIKYIDAYSEEQALKMPEYERMARDIFGHLLP